MSVLLLEPHQDDAVLFASFLCLRYRPHVVTVLKSQVQDTRGTGITNEQRHFENLAAFSFLGVTSEQLDHEDEMPDWEHIAIDLELIGHTRQPDIVIAPTFEEGGHEQHNRLRVAADRVFGDLVRPYFTYVRGAQRTVGVPVPFEPEWPQIKLKALACFRSQIMEPTTRDWFMWGQYEYAPTAWWDDE